MKRKYLLATVIASLLLASGCQKFFLAAELVDGETFNAAIPKNAKAVVFEYHSSVSSGTLLSTPDSPVPIYGNLDGTTWRVTTGASVINANPDCCGMFSATHHREFHSSEYIEPELYEIDFGKRLNTENVRDMSYMFYYCESLRSLDVSSFNTKNVTNMGSMFYNCESLRSLDVSRFNTKNVTNMGSMFYNCESLRSLDVSSFNTKNVTNMGSMFYGCRHLQSLDVSNFNTENVVDMNRMFFYCDELRSLFISNFNTEKVIDMSGMFACCSSLRRFAAPNFNTENVKNMYGMFSGCNFLTSLDLSNFNTKNVTNMNSMFAYCYWLESLDLSHFNMSRVTDKYDMCRGLSHASRHCTITCPLSVENAIKETDPYYNPSDSDHWNYYYSGLPTSGVTFTWVRPTSE